MDEEMYDVYFSDASQTPPSTHSSIYSNKSENVFFANITPDVNLEMFEEPEPMTPTTFQVCYLMSDYLIFLSFQRSLCLNATSDINTDLTDDEDQGSPKAQFQQKLCLCATSKPIDTQEAAQRQPKIAANLASFPCKTEPITNTYRITHEVNTFVLDLFMQHSNLDYWNR
jgi:hypothetical protein